MSDQHLILVDASGFAFRAYYSWTPTYRDSDGMPTWAILGFMSMLYRTLGRASHDAPTHGVAVFDAPGHNFRHQLYPAYKAHRDEARRIELDQQFPYMRHAAETLGLHPVEMQGFEADDLIATLASRAMKAGIRTTIVSSDKDFGQLVVDGKIEIVDPMQRKRVVEKDVRGRWGVEPALVPQVQALAGDAVDNIPGIVGCGPETAAKLIRSFGSLDALLKDIDEVRFPRIRRELKRDGAAQKIKTFLKLTTLRRNCPLKIDFEALRVMPIMESHIRAILRSLEASHKFDVLFTSQQKVIHFVEPIEDPFEWWREELAITSGKRGKLPEVPQCGFYKIKLVHGGPWVGARIWREPELDLETNKPTGRDVLRCEINGKPVDPYSKWFSLAMYPVKAAEFDFEMADADHAKKFRPDDPKANPHKAVDFMKMKAPHCPPTPPKAKSKGNKDVQRRRSKARS